MDTNKKGVLLHQIWEEKREKIITNDIYPLGISIAISDMDWSWHNIIYGILHTLKGNAKNAWEWARHWGRAIVFVHPSRHFDFKFTMNKSAEEKRGALLSTGEAMDPLNFLNSLHNIGDFKIIINQCGRLSLEMLILQVERMVDELVWCNYLRHKKTGCQDESEQWEIYSQALDEVWDRGVEIAYADEDEILTMKIDNASLAVRVYGDVLGARKMPRVIGAVLLDQETKDNRVSTVREEIMKINEDKAIMKDLPKLLPKKGYGNKTCVLCAITSAKKIHVGHLLLLSFAELVRNATASSSRIFLEMNDTGDRIAGLVARIASNYDISVKEALDRLVKEKINVSEIYDCYAGRLCRGPLFREAKRVLSSQHVKSLLNVFDRYNQRMLEGYGFAIHLINDSHCLVECSDLEQILGKEDWKLTGFDFVKYSDQRSEKKLIVLKKKGLFTASTARASFVKKVRLLVPLGITPVFVDAGPSVTQARDLLKLAWKEEIIQIEGTGVGFNMKIASASEGKIILAENLLDYLPREQVLPVITFYLLSRFATAKGHKKNALSKGHVIGLSFFDYKDQGSLLVDFQLCAEEFMLFCEKIANAVCLIGSCIKFGQREPKAKGYLPKEIRNVLSKLGRLEKEKRFEIILPRPRVHSLESSLREIREWLQRKLKCTISEEEIDLAIVQTFMAGVLSVGELAFTLQERDILPQKLQLPFDYEKPVKCLFVDNLKGRGYVDEEVTTLSMLYLRGDYCLVQKRCFYYECLLEVIDLSRELTAINEKDANLILDSIEFCISRLGLLKRSYSYESNDDAL